jgi:NitT/TauT family transport system substrate-binding protein
MNTCQSPHVLTNGVSLTLFLACLLVVSGCGGPSREDNASGENGLFDLTVQLDWVAEPEHGAFYTAQALDYFKEEGLDVTLWQGGAGAFPLNKVGTNLAQVGQADSTNVLVAIAEGVPLLNVASMFQADPSVLMMHSSNPVETWEDLDGKTIMARPEWAFIPWLRKKAGISLTIIPQNFELTRLIRDPNFIQQGFYVAEPYYVEKEGVELKYLYAWDFGFDAYTTIFTNKQFAKNHPEQLKGFLRALYRGYKYYVEVDPGPAHEIMLEINSKVTPEYLKWSRDQIIGEKLHRGNPSAGIFADYLEIDEQRYRKQIDQLEELEIIEEGAINVEDVMSSEFLPY